MRALIFIFFLLFSGSISAQVKTYWSTPFEREISNPEFEKILFPIEDSVSFVVTGRRSTLLNDEEYYLATINLFTLEKRPTIKLPLDFLRSKEKDIVDFVTVGNTICAFYTQFNRSDDKSFLMVSQYDKKGRPIRENIKLDSLQIYSSSRRGNFYIHPDPQHSSFLVLPVEPFEKAGNQKIRYTIYNQELKVEASRNFDLPFKAREVEIDQIEVGEDHNAYFLIKITDLFKRWSPGAPNFKYIMIESLADHVEIKEYEFDLNPKSISDIAFSLDSNRLKVFGLYSDNGRASQESSGFFFITIDPENRIILNTSLSAYPEDLALNYISENQYGKGREPEELRVKDILSFKDGKTAVVLEQFIYREICNTDMRTGIITCTENYYYNDLSIVFLNASGALTSFNIIPKAQFSSDIHSNQLSFFTLQNPENMWVLFNDHPRNELQLEQRFEKVKSFQHGDDGEFVAYSLKANNFEGEKVFHGVDRLESLNTRNAKKISDKIYLVFGEERRAIRFGIVKLE